MKNNFRSVRLGELASVFAGGDKPKRFSKVKTSIFNVPVYANGETNDGLQGYTTEAEVNEIAVTVSARGTIGYPVLRTKPYVPIVRLITLVPKNEKLNVTFLYYFLKLYRKKGNGSSQAQLTVPDISNRLIQVSDLSVQESVAKVLTELDSKIELNNKINSELESMAKLIYDYWFVQFDFPDENGKQYKSSGGKMIYNEELKREIPENWEVKEIQELAFCIMGQSPKGKSYNQEGIGTPLLNGPADYENGGLKANTFTTEPTRLCKKDDLVLCIRATIGNLVYSEKEFCLGRGVAAVRPLSSELSEYVYYLLEREIEIFKVRASGSIIKGIIKEDLVSAKVPVPNSQKIKSFSNIIKPHFDKIRLNKNENNRLAELRDWLLPILMNGQVTVKP